MKTDENSYDMIYCHFDGYPNHHLPILREHYGTVDAVQKLLALGNLSILDMSCELPFRHTFNAPQKGYCVAYGRDRGDKHVDALYGLTFDVLMNSFIGTEYLYIFDDNQWRCIPLSQS